MPVSEPSSASWRLIAAKIEHVIAAPFRITHRRPVAGGCINGASLVEGNGLRLFVKFNVAQQLSMFDAEADALTRLAAAAAIRVPEPLCTGIAGNHAFLALEYLALGDGAQDWARMGREFAAQHRVCNDRFGWHRDNTLGSTPQANGWMPRWIDFLRERRLGYQLGLAAEKGFGGRLQSLGAGLLVRLDRFFDDYSPQPSLLHGDLWSGNAGFLSDGQPVVFDPACYFGDREADLAMTELFGGFPAEFYRAYETAAPLHPGYRQRKRIYQLYHLLNHLNLFGAGYLRRCESTLEALSA